MFLLLLTTHTNALTAAYSSSTSVAMAISPNRAEAPPTFSNILATAFGQNVLTPATKNRRF